MKTISVLVQIIFLAFLASSTTAQSNHTQTVRGQIVDGETLMPLIGANVTIEPSEPVQGASTDADGSFQIESVGIGRKTLTVSYLGYEPLVVANILITTGKEVVLQLEMQEALVSMEEIVVKAFDEKSTPLNEMAIASARSFSVEETGRYASSLFDPARMAQNFAGVSTTGGSSDLFNEIIVRGNSPRGVLWKLEGIEIPNPNHFGALGNSGGGISMLSSSLLASSDFYSGAFPAEFGNATSGAFDLNLRKGNNQKREHSFMVGILGTEVASEGPIGPKGGASYLINFRYSTLGILQKIGLNPAGDVLPEYGDLSFNFYFPKTKIGQFNIFGLGGKNRAYFDVIADSTQWKFNDDMYGFNERQTVGTLGLSHKLLLNDRSYLHTVMAASTDQANSDEYYLNAQNNYQSIIDFETNFNNKIYRLSSTYHQKINAKNTFEIGGIISQHDFDFYARNYFDEGQQTETFLQDTGASTQFQAFVQWRHRVTEDWTITAGVHNNYFGLTKNFSIEPRVASKWNLNSRKSIHLALGIHSKAEHPVFYLTETTADDVMRSNPNANLDYIKSFHAVSGYDHQFSKDFRLKTEVYFQYLYDVPVEDRVNSRASMINTLDIWDVLDAGKAVNEGNGRNVGIDITLEKNFSKSYYFLVTGSIFDSKFRAKDGNWYNTRFNSQYQTNILAGKEYVAGKKKNRIIGLNGKFVLNGGNRITPINVEASRAESKTVYDND
ncbi:MAG: TonB-dependent receptor, partial [Saprospiraceae bacterium]|nr:TonB-dependent receptor [Saprospiraceae bacterium]